jgi:hypothetical protein
MDESVEQIIKIRQTAGAKVFKGAMIAGAVIAAITIPSTFALGMIVSVLFIVAAVVAFRYFNAEYEYDYYENQLTFARIASKSNRRDMAKFDVSKTELIAKKNSQEALRLERKKLNTVDFTSHGETEDSEIVVLYAYNENNEMERVFFEPNEKLTAALQRAVPRTAYKLD